MPYLVSLSCLILFQVSSLGSQNRETSVLGQRTKDCTKYDDVFVTFSGFFIFYLQTTFFNCVRWNVRAYQRRKKKVNVVSSETYTNLFESEEKRRWLVVPRSRAALVAFLILGDQKTDEL